VRLHLVALPHTRVEPAFCGCAYTAKVLKFCKMMRDRFPIVLYAPAGEPPDGVDFFPCLSDDERQATFGQDDPNRLPEWPTNEQSLPFNMNVIRHLREEVHRGDIVLLVAGRGAKIIVDALPKNLYAEPFVGYEGILDNTHRAFESYAWMHAVYGRKQIKNIAWFDTVIPPFCDLGEFPILNDGSGDYLLFLGRLIRRKGPHIAAEIAKASGLPLYVAGAGGEMKNGALYGKEGVKLEGVTHIGPVNVQGRALVLAGARALLCPTIYLEPGGNVAIEAMMAGTPVITADFGVFSETVVHGVSGFHFRMLREAVEAVKNTDKLDPAKIRAHAAVNYSLEAVASRFELWFDRLTSLWGKGWYA
jgi:glycosyltransferase involved in cell wall biosynthesis